MVIRLPARSQRIIFTKILRWPDSPSAVVDSQAHIVVAVRARPIRRLIELSLHLDGYRPQVFAYGQQALDHLLTQPCDLVLLDRQLMPVNGLTICKRLRSVTSAPVLLLLLHGDKHAEYCGRQVGVRDFCACPSRWTSYAPACKMPSVVLLPLPPYHPCDPHPPSAIGSTMLPHRRREIRENSLVCAVAPRLARRSDRMTFARTTAGGEARMPRVGAPREIVAPRSRSTRGRARRGCSHAAPRHRAPSRRSARAPATW